MIELLKQIVDDNNSIYTLTKQGSVYRVQETTHTGNDGITTSTVMIIGAYSCTSIMEESFTWGYDKSDYELVELNDINIYNMLALRLIKRLTLEGIKSTEVRELVKHRRTSIGKR